MLHPTINSWHAALMAVKCAHDGYGSSLLSLIVKRCAAWQAWMCLSHPWQLRSGQHQNHAMELTSELIVSDSVVGWIPNLNGAQLTTGRSQHWRPMAASATSARRIRAFVLWSRRDTQPCSPLTSVPVRAPSASTLTIGGRALHLIWAAGLFAEFAVR